MFSLSARFLVGFGEWLGIYLMGVNKSGDWEGVPSRHNNEGTSKHTHHTHHTLRTPTETLSFKLCGFLFGAAFALLRVL